MRFVPSLALVAFLATTAAGQQNPPRTLAQQTAGLERHDGFIPFYFDERSGRLLFEVSRVDQDFLYLYSLSTGIGSDNLGLDRSSTGDEAVVRFQRFGPRLFLVASQPCVPRDA